jgi:hypothetical protein
MPYIADKERRLDIDQGMAPENIGELNYAITRLVDRYLSGAVDYASINAAIGVLECAKLELYRRVAAPYESAKIAINGDVYECLKSI